MAIIRHSKEIDEKKKFFLAMSPEEFDNYMCKKYPRMFEQRRKNMKETCMCWGFEIGKGWYWILADLCEKLDAIYKKTGIYASFSQVKEKYGEACFYHGVGMKSSIVQRLYRRLRRRDWYGRDEKKFRVWCEIIDTLCSEAEELSSYICDSCAESIDGPIRIGTWYYGTCEECLVKWRSSYKEEVEYWNKHNEIKRKIVDALYCADDAGLTAIENLAKALKETRKNGTNQNN